MYLCLQEQFPAARAVSITSFFQYILKNGSSMMRKRSPKWDFWSGPQFCCALARCRASFQLAPSKYHQRHLYGHLSPRKSSPGDQQIQQPPPDCSTVSSSTSPLRNSHQSYSNCKYLIFFSFCKGIFITAFHPPLTHKIQSTNSFFPQLGYTAASSCKPHWCGTAVTTY